MKYPNKIKKNNLNIPNYANRGMTLENDINITNEYYLENNIAVIYKKPTPIKVILCKYIVKICTYVFKKCLKL